jgi:hypothetical protein
MQKNHGGYSLRECAVFLQISSQASLQMSFQKTPPTQQAVHAPCFFWTPILGNFFISRKARKAGTLAK